jgi:cytochrome c peroxidase
MFSDTGFSKSGKQSCASCHIESKAFQDGYERAVSGSQVIKRNTPSLHNLSAYSSFFWDGRAKSLLEQVDGPLFAVNEMNSNDELIVENFRRSQVYVTAFKNSGIVSERLFLKNCLVAYMQSLQTVNTKYWEFLNDQTNLSEEENRGKDLFFGRAGCSKCHTGHWLTNNQFTHHGLLPRKTVLQATAFGAYELGFDYGRADVVSQDGFQFAFRTPSLINCEITAPYMHDGAFRTLAEVVDFYDRGGDSPKMYLQPLGLSSYEKADLISFLRTLTDSRYQAESDIAEQNQ